MTLLLSGPAAGILGGQWAGALAGRERLITFDMGGTSADIGIVTEDGVTRGVRARHLGRRLPAARADARRAHDRRRRRLDRATSTRAARSASARAARAPRPGPACYGQGGQEPTISDAHVVLGRLDPERFLGGRMTLDRDAAVDAVERLAGELGLDLLETAEGILTIANSNMARAIRSRTIEKGHDPREFSLVAFGGAGPLHAAEVADSLEIPEVLVPPHPGITSAGGLLTSDLKYDQMRTVFQLQGSVDVDRLNRELDELEAELRAWLGRDGVPDDDVEVIRALDCRYVGQGYELRVTLAEGPFGEAALEQFHVLHEREYGSAYGDPIEIVNARVTAIGRRPALEAPPGRRAAASTTRSSARARASSGWTARCRRSRRGSTTARCCRSTSAPRPGGRLPSRHDDGRPARLGGRGGRLRKPDPDEGGRLMSTVETRVDPVTAAVIAGALDSIAVEMGHKLARMAYSSIIRESEDFGCVLCDAEGRQLCESSQSTPLQSGPIPGYIAGHQPPLRRARPRVEAG